MSLNQVFPGWTVQFAAIWGYVLDNALFTIGAYQNYGELYSTPKVAKVAAHLSGGARGGGRGQFLCAKTYCFNYPSATPTRRSYSYNERAKWHLNFALQSCISNSNFKLTFQICMSNWYLKFAFQMCISNLHFKLAFQIGVPKLYFNMHFKLVVHIGSSDCKSVGILEAA